MINININGTTDEITDFIGKFALSSHSDKYPCKDADNNHTKNTILKIPKFNAMIIDNTSNISNKAEVGQTYICAVLSNRNKHDVSFHPFRVIKRVDKSIYLLCIDDLGINFWGAIHDYVFNEILIKESNNILRVAGYTPSKELLESTNKRLLATGFSYWTNTKCNNKNSLSAWYITEGGDLSTTTGFTAFGHAPVINFRFIN